ncbi:hypothetical protein P389DRAFT_182312, partial [Cystobasidium minutum MCA 4210]|uniref:uncharacterized protein n=1 Tax=Cystobasidium minutum MCA 4210 TaxID=1397322 RepID=UPI0034CF85FF
AVARATYRRILSNFGWACIYNVILVPLAAGAFYDLGRTKLPAVWARLNRTLISFCPVARRYSPLVGASLAMALSSVSVVLNSLLLRYTFRVPKEVREYRDQL